ncbi:MAG: gliding motility-associated C-terminal domain-containing protein, partial [Bacteroidota bacterium]
FGNEQIVQTDANGDFNTVVAAGEVVYDINQNDPDFPTGAIQTQGTDPTLVYVAPDSETNGGENGFFVPDDELEGELFAHLYFDENGNGTQDPGEPDMPNVDVLITDVFGNEQIVQTDANGDFNTVVAAGEVVYDINQNDPDFPTGAIQTQGTDPTLVYVAPDSETNGGENGFFVPDDELEGELFAHLYFDENGNGTQDPGEPDMPNVDVLITDVFGNEQIVQTDANGDFNTVVAAGEVVYDINQNDPDFPTGAIQTEGTDPTLVYVAPDSETNGGENGFFVPDEDIEGELNAHLYFDENGNGTQDSGEPDMPNVEVEITDSFGNTQLIDTDANGNFNTIIVAGEVVYEIDEEDADFPTGAVQTEGNNPTTVFVTPNENTFGGDNGFFIPDEELEAIVSGHLYFDENGNGVQDTGEPDMPNVEVEITDNFGNIQLIDTDVNGYFEVLTTAGENTVEINEEDPDFPTGAIQTEGNNPTTVFAIADEANDSGNYGFFVPEEGIEGSIIVHLYFDENGNGTQDAGEPDMPNVDVDFIDGIGNEINLETNNNGNVNTSLTAGNITYEIDENDFDFPVGAIQTEGVNPTTLFVEPNTLTDGGNNGFFIPDEEVTSLVSGHLYFDENGDGSQNISEPNMPNIEIEIEDVFGNILITETDELGDFEVELPAGSTVVFINEEDPDFPEGAIQTEGVNPDFLFAVADQNNFSGNYGYYLKDDSGDNEEDDIVIYNAVSPNGDGKNEYFRIEGIENYPTNTLKIFNRGGVKVYDVRNYEENGYFRGVSDGRVSIQKNKKLPSGNYFYIFEYRDEDNNRIKKQGYLYLN